MRSKQKVIDAAALHSGIHELLAVAEIDRGQFLARNYPAVQTLYKFLSRQDPWRSHLSTFDLFDILGGHIRSRLSVAQTGRLVHLITAGVASDLQQEIQEYLRSLPRQYELWVALPSMPKWGPGEISVSANISLVETDEETGGVPLGSLSSLLLPVTSLSPKTVYVRVQCSGLGSSSSTCTAVANGAAILKQFLAAARGFEVFSRAYYLAMLEARPASEALLTDITGRERTTVNATLPGESLKQYLSALSIDESHLQVIDPPSPGETLVTAKHRPAVTRDEKTRELRAMLARVTLLLDCPDNSLDATRVKTALEWSFDSEESDNETLAILQACIGLEALLGDDDKDEPLTTRLADRCAYLLGDGTEDRARIRRSFRDIYDVRSKLIHGRRPRIGAHERELLYKAQHLLRRVIQAETANFMSALRNTLRTAQ